MTTKYKFIFYLKISTQTLTHICNYMCVQYVCYKTHIQIVTKVYEILDIASLPTAQATILKHHTLASTLSMSTLD